MFCRKCGSRCEETQYSTGYSSETGREEYNINYRCPINKCGHQGRGHNWKKIERSFISELIRDFSSKPDYTCNKCGAERKENKYD